MEKDKEIISKDLLEILACPACKTDIQLVEYKTGEHGLKCDNCKRIYPIKEGIPVMLIDQAIPAE
ncbi:MAG: Trm112 family protein [bacterium]|nr:Trm112 family protein [bacterium]